MTRKKKDSRKGKKASNKGAKVTLMEDDSDQEHESSTVNEIKSDEPVPTGPPQSMLFAPTDQINSGFKEVVSNSRKKDDDMNPTDAAVIGNLNYQLKLLQQQLNIRNLVIWKLEQELQEAGIDDMVYGARDAILRMVEDGEINNTPKNKSDEKELEALAQQALALLTEKLYSDRELDIDQKAYIHMAIISPTGQDHYRIQDVVDIFKDKPSYDVPTLTTWIYKWTNGGLNKFDKTCSCRSWINRSKKRIVAKYGFSASGSS